LQLNPALAQEFGVLEALFLQQLHYLLQNEDFGRIVHGERWIYNTVEEWQKTYFPFLTKATLKRLLHRLEQQGLIDTCQPEGRASRRKYYRISPANRDKISKGGKVSLSKGANCALPREQNEPLGKEQNEPFRREQIEPFPNTKITAETSPKTSPKKGARERAEVDWVSLFLELPKSLDVEAFRQAWRNYMDYRKASRKSPLLKVSILAQWKAMESWGLDNAIASIEDTIRQSWSGLFPPRNGPPSSQGGTQKFYGPNKPSRPPPRGKRWERRGGCWELVSNAHGPCFGQQSYADPEPDLGEYIAFGASIDAPEAFCKAQWTAHARDICGFARDWRAELQAAYLKANPAAVQRYTPPPPGLGEYIAFGASIAAPEAFCKAQWTAHAQDVCGFAPDWRAELRAAYMEANPAAFQL
jgi:DNA-binding PadR family transcriptional regulator